MFMQLTSGAKVALSYPVFLVPSRYVVTSVRMNFSRSASLKLQLGLESSYREGQ